MQSICHQVLLLAFNNNQTWDTKKELSKYLKLQRPNKSMLMRQISAVILATKKTPKITTISVKNTRDTSKLMQMVRYLQSINTNSLPNKTRLTKTWTSRDLPWVQQQIFKQTNKGRTNRRKTSFCLKNNHCNLSVLIYATLQPLITPW